MFIKEIIWQARRDFRAILECEHCKSTQKLDTGYDDAYYHNNVIPNIKCDSCGKIADKNYKAKETKYPEGYQI